MFTGIVEAVGRLEAVRRGRGGAAFRIAAPFASSLRRGDSVSVSGVCLTVTRPTAGAFEAEAVARTLGATTLGALAPGAEVNLERAVGAGEPLGGHFVTGHVDAAAVVREVRPAGRGRDVVIGLPPALMKHVAERGSIAVDGVSLTVALVERDRVTVSLIPETLRATIARSYRPGVRVNVETDLLAKYRASAENHGAAAAPPPGVTVERLRELGYLKERG